MVGPLVDPIPSSIVTARAQPVVAVGFVGEAVDVCG
jgi:hypothetical protein